MIFNKFFALSSFLFLLCTSLAHSKSADPASELSNLKEKYPDQSFISLLHKKDVLITLDDSGVPVMKIKDEQVQMILSESANGYSESKEYFNGKTDIKKFEAYSLVPSGNKYKKVPVTKIDKSAEFDDDCYFDDTWCYSFNFPSTGIGVKLCTYSEIEIKDPYHSLHFFFCRGIPVEDTELTVTAPENIRINYKLFGMDTLDVKKLRSTKGEMITYKWSSHRPTVREKDFMSPGIRYFLPHLIVNIESCTINSKATTYWGNLENLCSWMEQKIGSVNQSISPEVRQLTDSIAGKFSDQTDKVRAIYKWIQNSIKYIAIEDYDNALVPREASLVLKRRYGDCKDKSSLLTAMLRAIGEKASLASVGTRELPYKYSQFPFPSCANHMVCLWWNNDKPTILDGTSRHKKLEDVPAFIQGKECIARIEKGNYRVIEIPIAESNSNSQKDTIDLFIDGNLLTGRGKTTLIGEHKSTVIGHLDKQTTENQLKYWPFVISRASDNLIIDQLTTSETENADKPFSADYHFLLPDYLTSLNTEVYVNLNIERELNNLEIKPERVLPVEIESTKEHQIFYRLKIPGNMVVQSIPSPSDFSHPLFGFSQNYEQKPGELIMRTNLYIKTLLIEGENIKSFRTMVDSLKKAYRQSIVLSKK